MLRRFAPFVFCLRVFTGCAPDAENNAADNSVTLPEEPAALEHRTACASLHLLRNDSPERAPAGIEATLSTLNSDPLLRLVEKRLREAGRIETFLAPYRASDTKPDALGVLKRHSEAEARISSLLVRICYAHPDPAMAADIANLIAEAYLDFDLEQSIARSMQAVEDLRVRLEQQKVRVEESEVKLAEYRKTFGGADSEEREAALRKNLNVLHADRAEATKARDKARLDSGSDSLEYLEAQQQINAVKTRIAEAEEDLIAFSKARVEYNSLRRDLEVQLALYRTMVAKMRETRETVGGQVSSASIVERATAPTTTD